MDLLLQAPILDASGLPPVPADPRGMGRHVSWVVCAQGPEFHYGDRIVAVSPEWIDARVAAFRAHNESKPGWMPPVQLNHTDIGERGGDFFDLRRVTLGKIGREGPDPDDPRDTMLAAVAWADPDAKAKIEAKVLTHVSIGIAGGVQRPDTGEMLEGVPIEITKTALPHMGEARILGGAVMPVDMPDKPDKPEEEEVEAAEEMAPPVDPMSTMMDMLERILKIVAPQPAAPAAEMTTVEAQIVELTALVASEREARAKAEREAQRLTFSQAYPVGGSLTLTAEALDYLFECHANVAGFESIEAAYVAPKLEAPKPDAPKPVVAAQPIWATRVGTSHANPPVMETDELTISAKAIDAEATKDGIKDAMLALQLHTQYRAKGYTITTEEV